MKSKNLTIPFFFRRINDLEQFLPIVDYLLKKNYFILLICINYDFELNNFIKFTKYKKDKNIKIDYLYNFLYRNNFLIRLLCLLSRKNIFFKKIKDIILSHENNNNLKNFLNKYKIKTAVFDFPITNSNYLNLLSILRGYGSKIFGIYHGIWVRDINLKNQMIKKIFLQNNLNANHYDKVLSFSRDYHNIMKKFNNKNKFLYYGMVSKNKFKNADITKQKKIIKILYLDHSAKHGIVKSKVVKDLTSIKKYKNLELTIRPNTSIEFVKNKDDLEIFKKNKLKNNISYELSEKLIQNHDIIINPISSVVIKAYSYGKVIVHPAHYIPKDKMIWQRFRSCFIIYSTKDLIDLIKNYKKKKLDMKKYNKNCSNMYNYLIGIQNYNKKLKKIENAIIQD